MDAEIRNISKANLKRIDPRLHSKVTEKDAEAWNLAGSTEKPPGNTSSVQPNQRTTKDMDMQCEKGGDVLNRSL